MKLRRVRPDLKHLLKSTCSSLQALRDSLEACHDRCRVRIIHGAPQRQRVRHLHASASDAVTLLFHAEIEPRRRARRREGVESASTRYLRPIDGREGGPEGLPRPRSSTRRRRARSRRCSRSRPASSRSAVRDGKITRGGQIRGVRDGKILPTGKVNHAAPLPRTTSRKWSKGWSADRHRGLQRCRGRDLLEFFARNRALAVLAVAAVSGMYERNDRSAELTRTRFPRIARGQDPGLVASSRDGVDLAMTEDAQGLLLDPGTDAEAERPPPPWSARPLLRELIKEEGSGKTIPNFIYYDNTPKKASAHRPSSSQAREGKGSDRPASQSLDAPHR